jgi:hypothetical protein
MIAPELDCETGWFNNKDQELVNFHRPVAVLLTIWALVHSPVRVVMLGTGAGSRVETDVLGAESTLGFLAYALN